MKKRIVCLLCFVLLSVFLTIPAEALGNEAETAASVAAPQLHIDTVNGNGVSL